MSQTPALRITPVSSKADRSCFINLPNRIMAADPQWISPLLLERRLHLTPKTNPYFEHARQQGWIAWRGNEPVGRISAQIDRLHLERYHDDTAFFGMLDAEDNADTFAALIETAEKWLRENGIKRVRGPLSLSINDEVGLLVDGFDTPPVFMMGHAWPYYGPHIEHCGYRKVQDMLAYTMDPDFQAPKVMTRLVDSATQHLHVRPLDRKHFDDELEVLRDIFNDAWADNWGFVPFTKAEFTDMGHSLRLLVAADLIQVAEVDGEPAAFIVALPDVNQVIRKFKGHLLPLGWAKLLWGLKIGFPSSARVPLMGVRRKYHNTRLGPGLAFMVIDGIRHHLVSRGVKQIELSWILEDNAGMCNIIESIGGRAYKRYRVYERTLA